MAKPNGSWGYITGILGLYLVYIKGNIRVLFGLYTRVGLFRVWGLGFRAQGLGLSWGHIRTMFILGYKV